MALGMGWGQKVARLIAEFACEDPGFGGGVAPPARSRTGSNELGLHIVPELLINDRWMLTGIGLILVPDTPDVDRVGQEVV